MTLVTGAMSFRFTGQLNLRDGPLATLVPAMAFVVAGLLLLARTPVDATHAVDLLPAMILIGLGAGLGFPSLMTLAMSGATASDSGLASGLVIVAIATAVSVLRSRLPEGAAEPAAEPVAEPVAQGVEAPRIRVRPLPADVSPGGGCLETGT